MIFEFTIPGKPCGKGRPRFYNGRAITPKDTVNYETLVKLAFRQAYPNAEPIEARVPLMVTISAFYQIPASTTKKDREKIEHGEKRPTTKPDIDNLCKCVLDALNGVAYHDDTQIVHLFAEKWYRETPSVKVTIKEW